jgi:branched-chain amino acid transport system permease protein
MTLVRGSTYAILASGLALIYSVGRIINLGHTAFMMLAAYGIWFFAVNSGWSMGAAVAIAVVGSGLLGVLFYRFLLDRIRAHEAAILIVTIALAMAFQEVVVLVFGGMPRTIPFIVSGSTLILGIPILNQYLATLGIALVVLLIITLLLQKTKLGIAIRATSQDREIATLMGINVSTVLMITMGIGTALAGVAGVFLPPLQGGLTRYMWLPPLVMVLAVIILGGLGSFKGSFVAAFFIGLMEAIAVTVFPTHGYVSQAFAMAIMIIVLAVRPQGMFGTLFEEERL